jgi:ribonuclease BN (tRNA processing enzyme)
MLLTVLGCSGSAPGPNQPSSGYLLESDGFLLAIEMGTGTLAALQAVRDPFALDALLFSHLHPDHCADFSSYTVIRRYHQNPSRDPYANRLPVYAPREAPERFVAAYSPDAADRTVTDLSDVYDFVPLAPGTLRIGPFEVTCAPAAHPCEAYSFRITDGSTTFAYSGDTGPCDAFRELVSGVDTLLSEASWTHADDRPADLHLSGRQAGEIAAGAGVSRLLVTHILPWADRAAVLAEARAAFAGEVVEVLQGAAYEV